MDTSAAQISEVKVTGPMIDSMRSTRPWTMLLAVIGFIAVGFLVLIGILMMFLQGLLSQAEGIPAIFMGIIYIVMAGVYCMPSLYLYRYSSFLNVFLKDHREVDLESALSSQKSFWKFAGIICLITIGISVLGIIAAIMIPLLISHKLN